MEKKRQSLKNEALTQKVKPFEPSIKNLENEMMDDHGPVILGRRDRKPHLPESGGDEN
ncbi:MAG: hypothetical protein V4487_06100 [Chlamydiota bacterium]